MATKELISSLTGSGAQKELPSTAPNYALPKASAPGIANVDLSAMNTGLGEPEALAFRAALGTIAPTFWIAPSTYEIALEHFAPFRQDPQFVDPDIIEIVSRDARIFIEFKQRLRAEGHTHDAVAAIPSPEIVGLSERDSSGLGLLIEEPTEAESVPTDELEPTDVVSDAASVAAEVRDLSGLSTRQLGEIFPVARESFQRWISGVTEPTDENLQRLLALRHFLRALADRVDNPRLWLLAPLEGSPANESPFSLLRRGNLKVPWDVVSLLPGQAAPEEFTDSEGDRGIRVATSMRRGDAPTPADELDDYSEWFDEE